MNTFVLVNIIALSSLSFCILAACEQSSVMGQKGQTETSMQEAAQKQKEMDEQARAEHKKHDEKMKRGPRSGLEDDEDK